VKLEKDLISPEVLADRWKMTLVTLAQWRWVKKGPRYTKIGRQIFYRIADIIDYEVTVSQRSISPISQSSLNGDALEARFKRNFQYRDYERHNFKHEITPRLKRNNINVNVEQAYKRVQAENKRRF
jgi:hypothetical protein